MPAAIDRLIVNSPYEEPKRHWQYQPETRDFTLACGRRLAGYVVLPPDFHSVDSPGTFVEIPLANQIRGRVSEWRAAGYPGVTAVTKRLLAHWRNAEGRADLRFFFCQLEAVETLVWLREAPATARIGIDIDGDGGPWLRYCCKMATGSGKTVVMAMVIAWQILNKVSAPQDSRFSKHVLLVAPGLTVKQRLEVLKPESDGNYYEAFDVVPSALRDKLRQGKVLVRNWHALAWDSAEQIKRRRGVDKRGPKSDQAYAREVLGELASARELLVINDEAHHAWRVSPEASQAPQRRDGPSKDSVEQATVWVDGLDRLHRSRRILTCYDFSATPFVPTGKRSSDENLFSWIVSDFGLNDAIESGLVKTPRIVVRDDALPDIKTNKSQFYHIYGNEDVRQDLKRAHEPEKPLPDLVISAYRLLGYDWNDVRKNWHQAGQLTPPVMITVCNRTHTAARIERLFSSGNRLFLSELRDPARLLHIDSTTLKQAESREGDAAPSEATTGDAAPAARLTKSEQAERLRRQVDTVGKVGQPGEQIQNVISVDMLSEGWDAKTVTHIMGLRAFSSQLLCEQVVGRGLRRASYEVDPDTGLLSPEYVNVFGVPFAALPHQRDDEVAPRPTQPKAAVSVDAAKAQYEIRWPNVLRIEHVLQPTLSMDWSKVEKLPLDAASTPKRAELAPVLDGQPDVEQTKLVDLEALARDNRMQTIIFHVAKEVFEQKAPDWSGNRAALLSQLARIVEQFIQSDRIDILPASYRCDDLKRRLVIMLNMSKIVGHLWHAVKQENSERLEPVIDLDNPVRSTGDMRTWYTGRPCDRTHRSHINLCVQDSTWEASDGFALDHHDNVVAWVKNDHLGFELYYSYRGVVHKYRPDFLAKLKDGSCVVLETKGQESEQDKVKRRHAEQWVQAVNAVDEYGRWRYETLRRPGEIQDALAPNRQEGETAD